MMKIELKKSYDITKQDEVISSRVSKEIVNEFRAFCKANGLQMYSELNKAFLFYLKFIVSRTDRGLRKFLEIPPTEWVFPE